MKLVVLFLVLFYFVLECVSLAPESNTENPTLMANIFSVWTFACLTPLLRKGSFIVITEDDLPALVPSDESAIPGDNLQYAMEKQ